MISVLALGATCLPLASAPDTCGGRGGKGCGKTWSAPQCEVHRTQIQGLIPFQVGPCLTQDLEATIQLAYFPSWHAIRSIASSFSHQLLHALGP